MWIIPDVLLNSATVRRHLDTVDYSEDSESSVPLVKPLLPLVLDKRGLVESSGKARSKRERSSVPRLSVLIRVEEEYARRLRVVRKQFGLFLAIVFVVGLAAGVAVRSPELFRRASTSVRSATAGALNVLCSTR